MRNYKMTHFRADIIKECLTSHIPYRIKNLLPHHMQLKTKIKFVTYFRK